MYGLFVCFDSAECRSRRIGAKVSVVRIDAKACWLRIVRRAYDEVEIGVGQGHGLEGQYEESVKECIHCFV